MDDNYSKGYSVHGCDDAKPEVLKDSSGSETLPSVSDEEWSDYLDGFFTSGMNIKEYALTNSLSYDALKFRLYRDQRYVKKGKPHSSKKKDQSVKLLKADIVSDEKKSIALKLNGFDISLDNEESLNVFLKSIKSL